MISLGVIGECMLEFREKAGSYTLGYGGDVFNTAVYASRLGLDVTFFTATGDDRFSRYLVESWLKEGIATDTVRIIPDLTPSLYIIKTDETGERTFHYWREASPFIQWLLPGEYVQNLPGKLEGCQCVYFSGISLALLSDDDKALLLQILKSYRGAGGLVGFDPNYRPRLWQSSADAEAWIDRAYSISDIVFPSYDDEVLLRPERSKSNLIEHMISLGVKEVVMKDGAHGATVNIGGQSQSLTAVPVETVVDTTAAGDSFNGGYLSIRLKGGDAISSAEMGCKVAAKVIQHSGAIISDKVKLAEQMGSE